MRKPLFGGLNCRQRSVLGCLLACRLVCWRDARFRSWRDRSSMTLGHAKVAYTLRELDWRGLRFGWLGISADTGWGHSLYPICHCLFSISSNVLCSTLLRHHQKQYSGQEGEIWNPIQAVVSKYDGLALLSLMTHHRRPKAGPPIQSSQRERNPKGSHWVLCANAGRFGQRLWKTHICAYI